MTDSQLLLDLIIKLAPTGGKIIQDFLNRREKKQEISTDEINTLILLQLLDNENKIIATAANMSIVLTNHIENETKVLDEISKNLKQNMTALSALVTQIKHLRIDLKAPASSE